MILAVGEGRSVYVYVILQFAVQQHVDLLSTLRLLSDFIFVCVWVVQGRQKHPRVLCQPWLYHFIAVARCSWASALVLLGCMELKVKAAGALVTAFLRHHKISKVFSTICEDVLCRQPVFWRQHSYHQSVKPPRLHTAASRARTPVSKHPAPRHFSKKNPPSRFHSKSEQLAPAVQAFYSVAAPFWEALRRGMQQSSVDTDHQCQGTRHAVVITPAFGILNTTPTNWPAGVINRSSLYHFYDQQHHLCVCGEVGILTGPFKPQSGSTCLCLVEPFLIDNVTNALHNTVTDVGAMLVCRQRTSNQPNQGIFAAAWVTQNTRLL